MNEDIQLITEIDKRSPIAEAYRSIRTNLQFAGAGKELKYISFTSATPGEGKSTTISNVAITMGQDGKKVLLIDCDMRKPVQHKIFGLRNIGLSNIIAMGKAFDEVVQKDVYHNVDVLVCGPIPPNPSELLGSKRMQELLDEVKDKYDYILLDMPPILAVTDAAVMASKVDGVVFVIRSGFISPEEAKEAKKRLIQGRANILGVILNAVPQARHNGYGYGYYYYYYDDDHVKHKKEGHHHDGKQSPIEMVRDGAERLLLRFKSMKG